MTDILRLRFPPKPESVERARQVVERFRGRFEEPIMEDISLMLSELVTNSIKHSGSRASDRIEIAIVIDGRRFRVEVADSGVPFDMSRRDDSPGRAGGWGLFLVDQLADSWGVTPRSAGGKTVWFELDASNGFSHAS